MHIQFSNAGVEAVRRSHCHASRLGHHYVGTEHLLLALFDEVNRDEVVGAIIHHFDLSIERVEAELLDLIGVGTHTEPVRRPNTPRLTAVYAEAQTQALCFASELVRPRHLLIALTPASLTQYKSEQSVASIILARLGVSFDRARADAIQVLIGHERQSYALAMSED